MTCIEGTEDAAAVSVRKTLRWTSLLALVLPACVSSCTYVTVGTETLCDVARAHSCTVQDLLVVNPRQATVTSGNPLALLLAGTVLSIPSACVCPECTFELPSLMTLESVAQIFSCELSLLHSYNTALELPAGTPPPTTVRLPASCCTLVQPDNASLLEVAYSRCCDLDDVLDANPSLSIPDPEFPLANDTIVQVPTSRCTCNCPIRAGGVSSQSELLSDIAADHNCSVADLSAENCDVANDERVSAAIRVHLPPACTCSNPVAAAVPDDLQDVGHQEEPVPMPAPAPVPVPVPFKQSAARSQGPLSRLRNSTLTLLAAIIVVLILAVLSAVAFSLRVRRRRHRGPFNPAAQPLRGHSGNSDSNSDSGTPSANHTAAGGAPARGPCRPSSGSSTLPLSTFAGLMRMPSAASSSSATLPLSTLAGIMRIPSLPQRDGAGASAGSLPQPARTPSPGAGVLHGTTGTRSDAADSRSVARDAACSHYIPAPIPTSASFGTILSPSEVTAEGQPMTGAASDRATGGLPPQGLSQHVSGGTLSGGPVSNTSNTALPVPPLCPSSAAVPPDSSQLCRALQDMHVRGRPFARRFTVLSEHDRQVSTAAAVQFMVDGVDQVAVKFYTCAAAFKGEAATSQDADLQPLLAATKMVVSNQDRRVKGVDGYVFPPYVVMEKGVTLQTRIASGYPEVAPALHILKDVLVCLKAMHGVGWVHRNVKLTNILQRPKQKQWSLIDFSTACRTGRPGRVVVANEFCAPEVLRARLWGADMLVVHPSEDMWSFGLVAFELLRQQPVFEQDTNHAAVQTCLLEGSGQGLPWHGWEIAIPILTDLHRLVLRCLVADSVRRPSARSVLHELDRVLPYLT